MVDERSSLFGACAKFDGKKQFNDLQISALENRYKIFNLRTGIVSAVRLVAWQIQDLQCKFTAE